MLIVPSGRGLKIEKEATFNKDALPIDYMLMAGIFRNIAEQCTANELIKGKMDERYQSGKDWASYQVEKLTKENAMYKEAFVWFEKSSGLRLNLDTSGKASLSGG